MNAPLATRTVGRTSLQVPVLGLGGAPLGDLYERIPEGQADATIAMAYEAGIRLFDTAPLYGHGRSEHRFGHALRDRPRDSYVLSTKVGRWLEPAAAGSFDAGQWPNPLNFRLVTDYSYDGTMRALEQSFQRLGIDRIDIVFIHDLDIWTHGTREAFEAHYRTAVDGAFKALAELRGQGVIKALGLGVNEVEPCVRFARDADPDLFMLAGRYTLLEQGGLSDLFPLAEEKGFSFFLAGPYNSGILATGAIEGAKYNYVAAPDEILERVRRIEKICWDHKVPLAAAAIRFPLGHPQVAAIIPGAVKPDEVVANLKLMTQPIPRALWDDLRTAGLLESSCPVPG